MRILGLTAAFIFGLASMAQAATLNETDVVGGFSSNFGTPTTIGSGFENLTGTPSGSDADYLHFTSLAAGAQTFSLSFDLGDPTPASFFDVATGSVGVSLTAPTASVTGVNANYFLAGFASTTQTLTYSLGSGFTGGSLYVSILPTFSTQSFSFGIDIPGNATPPAPVPVPAAGLLLLGALGGFVALRRRKSPALAT
jgi:hypothetical protein